MPPRERRHVISPRLADELRGLMASQKYKTCRRYDDLGHAHALTFSCFRRQPLLSKPRTCQWLAEAILLARRQHALHVWAYVFMPEHAHVLLWPTGPYDISKVLATIK